MAKTRMMTQKGECYLCGALGQTEEHLALGDRIAGFLKSMA